MMRRKKELWESKEEKEGNGTTADIGTENLETRDERKSRIRSIWIIYIEMFIFAISFSIVITGVLPYLRQVSLINYIYVEIKPKNIA